MNKFGQSFRKIEAVSSVSYSDTFSLEVIYRITVYYFYLKQINTIFFLLSSLLSSELD